jgi:hypothetical protein
MDVNGAKYARLFSYIHNFRMRDKRVVFSHMRRIDNGDVNVLFPAYAVTASEFTVAYVNNMCGRMRKEEE